MAEKNALMDTLTCSAVYPSFVFYLIVCMLPFGDMIWVYLPFPFMYCRCCNNRRHFHPAPRFRLWQQQKWRFWNKLKWYHFKANHSNSKLKNITKNEPIKTFRVGFWQNFHHCKRGVIFSAKNHKNWEKLNTLRSLCSDKIEQYACDERMVCTFRFAPPVADWRDVVLHQKNVKC